MRDSLPSFEKYLTARFQSARTIDTYLEIASSFAAHKKDPVSTAPPSVSEIESFIGRPRHDGTRRVATSRNQALSALRAFAAFGVRELGWTEDPTADIEFAHEPSRDPAVLTIDEMRTLFTTAARIARPSLRRRDLAILALLSQSALRVHELVALNIEQIDDASKTLLAVKGKGSTVHDIPLDSSALALVRAWIDDRACWKINDERALFLSHSGRRLSVRAVQQLFVRLRVAMRTAKKITPHTMRHSAATLALYLGTDLINVAGLLRHTDLNTTRGYISLIDTQRREAVRRLATTIPDELLAARSSPLTTDIVPQQPTPAATAAAESRETSATDPPCAHHDMDATSASCG
ncbi:MAG: tyrosine-type recombinase/integrase [Myxococcales bacterium]|nr:tyrosine-type recombinase/integrase [Myxococcales bacterium]